MNTLTAPTPSEIALHRFMQRPLQKNAGLQINIARYFTDINGTIILKTNPLVAASGMNVSFPFWMFGQFDRAGGYKTGNTLNPPVNNTKYVGSFVAGNELPPLFATGLNTIKNTIKIGDLFHIFTDNLDAPSIYCFIVQSGSFASVASIYANALASEYEKIEIESANYTAYTNGSPTIQFLQNVNLTRIDVVGAWNNNPLDPASYIQVDDKQPQLITVPITFVVDQYNLLGSYIDFTIDSIQFAFKIKKNTKRV